MWVWILRNPRTLKSESQRHCGPPHHPRESMRHRVTEEPTWYSLGHLPREMPERTAGHSDCSLPSGLSRRNFLLYLWVTPPKSKQEVLCYGRDFQETFAVRCKLLPSLWNTQSSLKGGFNLLEMALSNKLTLWVLMVKISFCWAYKLLFLNLYSLAMVILS